MLQFFVSFSLSLYLFLSIRINERIYLLYRVHITCGKRIRKERFPKSGKILFSQSIEGMTRVVRSSSFRERFVNSYLTEVFVLVENFDIPTNIGWDETDELEYLHRVHSKDLGISIRDDDRYPPDAMNFLVTLLASFRFVKSTPFPQSNPFESIQIFKRLRIVRRSQEMSLNLTNASNKIALSFC